MLLFPELRLTLRSSSSIRSRNAAFSALNSTTSPASSSQLGRSASWLASATNARFRASRGTLLDSCDTPYPPHRSRSDTTPRKRPPAARARFRKPPRAPRPRSRAGSSCLGRLAHFASRSSPCLSLWCLALLAVDPDAELLGIRRERAARQVTRHDLEAVARPRTPARRTRPGPARSPGPTPRVSASRPPRLGRRWRTAPAASPSSPRPRRGSAPRCSPRHP